MNNIDPNAVCISYTMKEKDEALVTAFRNMLKEAGIPYNCSQEPIDNTVSEFEDIIGRGTIVVIFYSPDYFKSPHCMNEYALARKNEVHNNIFTVRCYKFVYNDIFRDLVRFWSAEEGDFRLITTNHTKVQEASKSHDFYLQPTHPYSIQNLSSFFPDNPYYTEKNLDVLFEKVKGKYYELAGKSKGSNIPAKSLKSLPASIDDISFNSIDFNYNKPKNKQFYGRDEFIKKIRDCFLEGKNSLNVVATGGMGKTSVAHRYIEVYGDQYKKKLFVTSNDNICQDFNQELRRCIKRQVPDNDIIFQKNENDAPFITSQIDLILGKAPNDCLLIIDVNIDKEGLEALKLSNAETKWHILYLSRKRINGTLSDGFELPNFENDLIAARELFCSVYKPIWFDKEKEDDISKLNNLFKLVYYHPLLIEQLAVYGKDGDSTYDELCDVVSKNRIENEMTKNPDYCKYSTCFLDKEQTLDVCLYLKQLITFKQFDKREDIKYVLQHLIYWQYEYISLDTINQLLKKEGKSNFKRELNYLTDRVILSSVEYKKSDGIVIMFGKNEGVEYRIHGLLADNLKNEMRDQSLIFDYSHYIANVISLLSSDEKIDSDSDIYKCIDNTPLEIFGIGSNKNYIVYEDWQFLRGLAQLKWRDTKLSELSYKAYLFKEFYNYSGQEIYNKVYGEYKDVSSHLIYNEWLYTKSNYNNDLPNEESDDFGKFIVIPVNGVSFKMRKVNHGSFLMGSNDYPSEWPVHNVTLTNDFYIGEVQVTQQLWMAVMGENNNPSHFNEGEKTNNHPVEFVSWYDCMDFIVKLNELMEYKDYQFRLPTEAEWEYAARSGGKSHEYSWNTETQKDVANNVERCLKNFAWFNKNSGRRTHPVATDVLPNELGIYDMSGNVWEWCQDWAGDYSPKSEMNPQGLIGSPARILRGGSWDFLAQNCRVSDRHMVTPITRYYSYGFRLLLSSQKNDEE